MMPLLFDLVGMLRCAWPSRSLEGGPRARMEGDTRERADEGNGEDLQAPGGEQSFRKIPLSVCQNARQP